MSKQKRARIKQGKMNTPAKKTRRLKKAHYVSCHYAIKIVPAECKLPDEEALGGFWCLYNCKINCLHRPR